VNAIGRSFREATAISPLLDCDMDALHVLPLHVLPLHNDGIAKHKLIKNAHLVGVLEAYSSRESGSGHVPITSLPEHFGLKNAVSDPDFNMLLKLAVLPSYDVYSLRRSLRSLGITTKDNSALKLSDDMNRELAGYMARFTKPLLISIYGDTGAGIGRFDDLVGLFREPDVKKALGKLKMMSEKLGVTLEEIPKFIEDYGDIFLSLSYYQHCLDRIRPTLEEFHRSVEEMKASYQMKSKPQVIAEANRIQKILNALLTFVTRMFEDFALRSQDMWRNLSAEKFKHVKDVIENAHGTVGGVLCGLTVKMTAWEKKFPTHKSGSPGSKEDFLLTDIRPGLSELMDIARGQASVVGYT
jgi:hypothetical protein